VAGRLEVVDDEPDVTVLVGRLSPPGRERDELIAHVDEGHPLALPAQREVEDGAVEVERRLHVSDLEGDVVHPDEACALRHDRDDNPFMDRVNLFAAEVQYDDGDPEGYHAGCLRVGQLLGGRMLGATIYELGPGQSNCPYHYEYGNEEWLVVLRGTLTLRHAQGENELEPGDVVCFPVGPDGAHKLTNKAEETVRVLIVSTQVEPAVAVYPDSDKIGVWPGAKDDNVMVRRESGVDYWDGEV
jgi:uncharacterized cupin superfamily protein